MLKIKYILLLIMLTSLLSCMESETEINQQKHLKQYDKNVANILKIYLQNTSSSSKGEDILNAHLTVLENLNKVKKHFASFKDEEKLQIIIRLYDSALNHLIVRQIQILELAKPIWSTNLETLTKIKNNEYYQQHQGLLLELIAMIEEYKDIVLDHHEKIRKELVASSLTKEERQRIWPSLNIQISNYLFSIKPKLKSLKKRVAAEIEIVKFLHDHRNDYIVSNEYGLQFKNILVLNTYRAKINSLNHRF